ncbi:FecR domain-containing protein [Paenibacillus sp. sptzw28]|uniref:FecR domain-containing protein n=1 Tax=Paenibacillus sp. sptzw28 TaxID=715179 RepID=UPI001C6E32BE|nr:FecR domain-containing protein [Paenibacillus sp. sptzw28]QYR23449.1 FecR domain-containing protein [Paenibacillus sp. sptzw28]
MNTRNRILLMALCLMLLAGPAALFAGAGQASAQVMRVAIVKSKKGTVQVLKSGGSKPFAAFNKMSLNEGDQIVTGKDGGVELELASEDAAKDSVTIGASSQVTFTKLKESGGQKTKMSVWAGSLWLKVKSVSNANDRFEVETPTSIMGVRGTHFFVGVDPETGLSYAVLAAGLIQIEAERTRRDSELNRELTQQLLLYPSQQLVETNVDEGIKTAVSVFDPNSIIQNASSNVIEAIIKDSRSIKEEQQETIDKLKQELIDKGKLDNNMDQLTGGMVRNREDLDRLTNNLFNFVSLVAEKAVDEGKVSEKDMQNLIDQVNKEAGEKLVDITSPHELRLTVEEQRKLQEAAQLIAAEKRRAEIEKERKAASDQLDKDLIDKLKQMKSKLDAFNKEAAEAARKAAEERFYNQLSDAQKKTFDENKKSNEGNETAQPDSATGSVNTSPVTTPMASLQFSDPAYISGSAVLTGTSMPVELNLVLSGFTGSSQIYGYQIEVEYDSSRTNFDSEKFSAAQQLLNYRSGGGVFKVEPVGAAVSGADSVDHVRQITGETKSSVIYSVTKFSGGEVEVKGETTVLKLPFVIYRLASIPDSGPATVPVTYHIKSITAVDANGNKIGTAAGRDLTLNVTYKPTT